MISFKLTDGDYSLNGNGGITRATGVDSLKQSVQKILMTDRENVLNEGQIPYRYNPDYGTNLNYIRLLNPIFTTEDARKAVQEEARDTLLRFASLQTQRMKYGMGQDELLADATVIASVVTDDTANEVKRTIITFEIELIAASGKTSSIEIESNTLG